MKIKILIFTEWYKPGFKAGGPIRSIANFCDHLSGFIDIFIVTTDTDYLSNEPYKGIIPNSWLNTGKEQIYYLNKENIHVNSIKKIIEDIKPDIVYVNSLYSFYFTLIPIRYAKKLNIKCVLAPRGMLSKGSLAVKPLKKKLFLKAIKLLKWFENVYFHATSVEEKKDIEKHIGKNVKIQVLKNLPLKTFKNFHPKLKKRNSLRITTIARIAPEKNTLYALEIIKQLNIPLIYDIYGPIYNLDYWQKCKAVINHLNDNIVVNYMGEINPNEIPDKLNKYHVFFLPTTGENYGHAIVESMFYGCIPVISNKTPWNNLEDQKIGFDIDLSNKNVFIDILEKIYEFDQDEFNQWSENAHKFALKLSDSTELTKEYLNLFNLN